MSDIIKPYRFTAMDCLEDFQIALRRDGFDFPVSDDLSVLIQPVQIGSKTCPNALAVQPLEGFDFFSDGSPGPLSLRRYERFAAGGAGMIWFEACAVSRDGRSNPRQLWINDQSARNIRALALKTDQAAQDRGYPPPYKVLQLTHSGRGSCDENLRPVPLSAFYNPYIDSADNRASIVTDERLVRLEEEYVHAAVLAAEAGFDAVDIKVCHNYLLNELLAAFTRPGIYGGSFENRTRFLFSVISRIRKEVGDAIATCVRLNAFDSIPYPYGWGMAKEEGSMITDITEPVELVKLLSARGVRLINISGNMPKYAADGSTVLPCCDKDGVSRPYAGALSYLQAAKAIKRAVPEAVIVGTGLSWLEQFGAHVGAGGIKEGWFDIAGFGRQALAYPDFASDIIKHAGLQKKKCCIACDRCFDLIGAFLEGGCVLRDKEIYAPLFRQIKEGQRG